MAFSLKTWVNRISEYPNRRKLTHEDGSTELVTVARAEGQISAEGNAFSAEEMNDLENRINDEFEDITQSLTYINDNLIPYICVAAPVICYALNVFSKANWGYAFGYELLLLNGGLAFAGLWLAGRKTALTKIQK